jgi:hypothetical protein
MQKHARSKSALCELKEMLYELPLALAGSIYTSLN